MECEIKFEGIDMIDLRDVGICSEEDCHEKSTDIYETRCEYHRPQSFV